MLFIALKESNSLLVTDAIPPQDQQQNVQVNKKIFPTLQQGVDGLLITVLAFVLIALIVIGIFLTFIGFLLSGSLIFIKGIWFSYLFCMAVLFILLKKI